jgi:Tfp pilus assembly major pilin PilA
MKRVHGLTLIEVAIAVLVGTLLFVVGMPAYQDRVTRQIVTDALELATPAKETIQEYASIHGSMPATADVALPFVTSQYIVATAWAASGAAGSITVSTRSGPGAEPADLDGKAIVLAASYDAKARTIRWTCGGTRATTVADEHLPGECRAP